MKQKLLSAAMALSTILPSTAFADTLSAFLYEESGDVILEYFGSIDTTDFFATDFEDTNAVLVVPALGLFGAANGPTVLFRVDIIGPAFGLGNGEFENGTATGMSLLVDFETGSFALPQNYLPGSDFMGSGTLSGITLAGLQADPGQYVYQTFANNAVTNTITLTVGSPPPPIPLPATLPLLSTGLGGLLLWRRRAAS